MIVTTGARFSRSLSSCLISTSCIASCSKLMVLVEAPNSRAISLASLESRVWLIVAKMLRSTSFLITRLALTSNFSESSLTVMPSEMVMARLMGGDLARLAAGWPGAGFSLPAPLADRAADEPRAYRGGGVAGPVEAPHRRPTAGGRSGAWAAGRRDGPGLRVWHPGGPRWVGRGEWGRDRSAGPARASLAAGVARRDAAPGRVHPAPAKPDGVGSVWPPDRAGAEPRDARRAGPPTGGLVARAAACLAWAPPAPPPREPRMPQALRELPVWRRAAAACAG